MDLPFNTKLAQVALVVRDMEKARHRFAALLGIEPPEVITTAPGSDVSQTYRGAPSNDRAKLAFIDLGGVQLELIEPLGSDNAWAEGMDEKGERLHHLAFWTESIDAAVMHMAAQEAPLIMRGDFGDHSGEFAYFDGQESFGCFIELLARKSPNAEHL